ncbi:MAG: hypothetical protein V7603_2888 [Micromonosporaceae bacterium]
MMRSEQVTGEAITSEADDETPARHVGEQAPHPGRPIRSRLLTLAAVLAVALFALWGIGGPLVGTSVLASTDEMAAASPYVDAGVKNDPVTNFYLDDIYTAQLPGMILFKHTGAGWNPYVSGGTPLGAVPDGSFYSPLTLPFFLLPTWLGPAYERLLEIICAAGACFLFLRRLRLSRPAAVAGGLVYASSGFMVVWLSFGHTRVAAFIPALFWTLERLIQQRRLRDAALVALPVAAMLLGGFPSVAGYAMLTAAGYALVRVLAEYRADLGRVLRLLLGAGAAALAGIGLAAFQLLPFLGFYRTYLIEGRSQTGDKHLDPGSLITSIAPWALGTADPTRPPLWYPRVNLVESMSYLGAGAVVLVIVAIAGARAARTLLPRAGWLFLAVAALFWAELIYLGGPPLAVLQHLPGLRALFGGNFIGRSRGMLCFLLAALAAVGLDLLLRRREARRAGDVPPPAGAGWRRWLWPAAVWVLAAAGLGVALGRARVLARRADARGSAGRVAFLDHQVLIGLALLAAALIVTLVLWRARGALRVVAATALVLLIAGQGISFVRAYYPHSLRDTFYPVTDTHRYLAANLGDERYASSQNAMVFGTNTAYRLRSVDGHAFINRSFAALVRGIPGNPIDYATYIRFNADQAQATSPILDVLGTRYFVTAPQERIFGTPVSTPADGTSTQLRPEQPVTVPVPTSGRTRAVGVTPAAVPVELLASSPTRSLEVVVRDASGTEVARSRRRLAGLTAGTPFLVPVAADSVPAGTRLTATITLHAPAGLTVSGLTVSGLTVAGHAGVPAVSAVAGAEDGLRLVHADTSVIYQRRNAQPRIRWAGHAVVEPSQGKRVAALASGSIGADTVVLSAPGPAAAGGTARVDVRQDDPDGIAVHVDAAGAGYLVVADADQRGWVATVDGRPVPLVAADQGLVAVPVTGGPHTVRLRFAAPHQNLGIAVTAAAVLFLVAVLAGDWWWSRRRGRRTRTTHAVPPTREAVL